MGYRHPLPHPGLDAITADDRATRTVIEPVLDRYDIELPGGLTDDTLLDGIGGEDYGDALAAEVTGALRRLARTHEQETGTVPDWVAAVTYRDCPGWHEPVRPVFDHWSAKATYVDRTHDHVLQLPTMERTLQGRLEQVLTWEHNQRALADAGLTPVPDYDHYLAPLEEAPYAVAVAPYNDDLVLWDELSVEQRAAWSDAFERVGEAVTDMVLDGTIAAATPNEYMHGGQPGGDLALDTAAQEVVVVDVGELHDPAWQVHDALPYDDRDAFLVDHGIDDRVDAILDGV